MERYAKVKAGRYPLAPVAMEPLCKKLTVSTRRHGAVMQKAKACMAHPFHNTQQYM
jgi:hypothetical protein